MTYTVDKLEEYALILEKENKALKAENLKLVEGLKWVERRVRDLEAEVETYRKLNTLLVEQSEEYVKALVDKS